MERRQHDHLVHALRSLSDGQAHVSQSGFVFLMAGVTTFHPIKSLGFEELKHSFILVSRVGRAAARAADEAGALASALLVQPLDAESTSTATMGALASSDSRTLGLQASKSVATNLLLPLPLQDARVVLSMIGPNDSDSDSVSSRLPPVVVVLADGYLGRSYGASSASASGDSASAPSYAVFKINNDTPHNTASASASATASATATATATSNATTTSATTATANTTSAGNGVEFASMDMASVFRSFEARAAKSGKATNLGV